MTQSSFENALRILSAIDRHELVMSGVIAAQDQEAWLRFRANPYRWLIRADDATADRLWGLVESRQGQRAA